MSDAKWVGAPREEYLVGELSEADMSPDPITQFRRWLDAAKNWGSGGGANGGGSGVRGLDEMVVSTVSADGRPSARVVLLKAVLDPEPKSPHPAAAAGGLVFATNYESRKGRHAAETAVAAVTVWWKEMERQVRWEGRLLKAPAELSDRIFAERPRDSRLAAWASRQSAVLENRTELDTAVAEMARRFEGQDIPRPEFWGAYIVTPERVEFWQGRKSRLHDRLEYSRPTGPWQLHRLSP